MEPRNDEEKEAEDKSLLEKRRGFKGGGVSVYVKAESEEEEEGKGAMAAAVSSQEVDSDDQTNAQVSEILSSTL